MNGMQQPSITIDESARARILKLREIGGSSGFGPDALLRVTVTSGGCSGFQYVLAAAAPETAADDVVFDGVVVTDTTSLGIMHGSRVVFEDSMMGARFVVDNPNASSGCGCGTSFAIKN